MRHTLATIVIVAVGVLFVSVPMGAHHSNAAFDVEKTVTLQGTVTEWLWSNPHCLLQFDVKDRNGKVVQHWVTETSNPRDMTNLGWARGSLKVGDQLTVTVYPARNGRPVGRIFQVALPGGQTLSAFPGGPRGAPGQGAK